MTLFYFIFYSFVIASTVVKSPVNEQTLTFDQVYVPGRITRAHKIYMYKPSRGRDRT